MICDSRGFLKYFWGLVGQTIFILELGPFLPFSFYHVDPYMEGLKTEVVKPLAP